MTLNCIFIIFFDHFQAIFDYIDRILNRSIEVGFNLFAFVMTAKDLGLGSTFTPFTPFVHPLGVEIGYFSPSEEAE